MIERALERFQHPTHVDVPGASTPDVGPAHYAPGWARVFSFTPGISLTSFAIRRSFPKGRALRGVETISEFYVSIIFPFDGSASRRPLPSTGYPRGGFPRLSGTVGRSDSRPPFPPHFVSFAWRYRSRATSSLPLRAGATRRGLEVF